MKIYKIKIPKIKLSAPPYHLKSEKEMSEIIHKYKVIFRKNEIKDIKNDIRNCKIWNMETYCQSERRSELFKLGVKYLLAKI